MTDGPDSEYSTRANQAIGMVERQRPQHHRVDDAEDGGVGADAERDGEHDGEREQRRLAQHSNRVAKIVQHGPSRAPSYRRRCLCSLRRGD